MRKGHAPVGNGRAKLLALALACLPALSACETFLEAEAVRDHPVEGKLVDGVLVAKKIQAESEDD